ncbi:MAG: FecR domain-containing protein [Candidatus Peribacteraceae bacterium]|nr:FecR domain-containing protein [Candidatus Peribacteraceae bacterium]
MRRRHCHRPMYLERRSPPWTRYRPLIGLLIAALLVYLVGSWFIGLFGYGQNQSMAIALAPEERGIVRISIEDGEWKRADQSLKLYPRDRVTTGTNAGAALAFFDGTYMRLGEESAVRIVESDLRDDESQLSVQLESGSVWVAAPTTQAFSGTMLRLVTTGMLRISLPTRTEALITERSISVFDGDGIGCTVHVAGAKQPVIVGEGQVFSLPEGALDAEDDLYAFRKGLDPRAVAAPFLAESRQAFALHRQNDQPQTAAAEENDPTVMPTGTILSVSQPTDRQTVQTASLEVKGSVNPEIVTAVQINGYAAPMDSAGGFALEITLPDKDEVPISILATGKDGITLAEAMRTVLRNREPPEPPHFLTPAKDGETYQTQRTQFEITGSAPADAIGIIVNDYRLQFFSPGDKTWKYLASTNLDNLRLGENTFTAVAINKGGYKSEPVTMKIVLGGGMEGVIARSEGGTANGTQEEGLIEPTTLPDNDPLQPGTISVTAPTPGARHTASGTDAIEFLIEGTVPAATHSVWVNGYQLRLYESGKNYWNYIASTKLNTMKRGENAYAIVARDRDGKILDRFTYVIEFDPRG